MGKITKCKEVFKLINRTIVSHRHDDWLTILDELEEEKGKVKNTTCSEPGCQNSLFDIFEEAIMHIQRCRRNGMSIELVVERIIKKQKVRTFLNKIESTRPIDEVIYLN